LPRHKSDAVWERFGKTDPYYGVLSENKYRSGKLTDATLAEFFETGRHHVAATLERASRHFGELPGMQSALDFGTGVGRVAIPLAERFERVTGVDISPSMIAEARKNCAIRQISNITFVLSDDMLSSINDRFDFVHSIYVFQHMTPQRGYEIIDRLLDLLKPGGIVAIQINSARKAPPLRRAFRHARGVLPPLNLLTNIALGKPWREPLMEMNDYDLNRLASLMLKRGLPRFFVGVSQADGFVSAYVIAKRDQSV
jgi:SAM-dependent methyltransferase